MAHINVQNRENRHSVFVHDAVLSVNIAREDDFVWSAPEVTALHHAAGSPAFQHPLWLAAFYNRLVPARNASPIIITGRDIHTGKLRFVLPLILRRKSTIALLEATDLGVSDYATPLVDRDWLSEASGKDDFASAVRKVLPVHDILRLRPVRAEDVALWQIFLPGQTTRLDFGAHAVLLSPPLEHWRSKALSPSFGRYLERKRKRFFKGSGARLRLLTDPSEIEAGILAIARLRVGRFDDDLIQNDAVRDFYSEVATKGAAEGLARTYVLERDGEALGYTFGLTSAGRFNYLLIGCDYDTHGRHSPGLLMYDGMIADWIASGGTVFDFTIGDEPFKADFGTNATAMFMIGAQPTIRGRLANLAFEAKARLSAVARRPKTAVPPATIEP